jgi:histidine triad (HIT) family protein
VASIFTRIINGEIPCFKIAEDELFIAFLDIRPQQKGHTLVVPKLEIDYIFDQPDEVLQSMLTFARPIAKAIEQCVTCKRVGLAVVGLEVPHAHLHLIPIKQISDLSFSEPKKFSDQEMESLAAEIRSYL